MPRRELAAQSKAALFPGPILPYRPSKNNAEKEIAFPEEIHYNMLRMQPPLHAA